MSLPLLCEGKSVYILGKGPSLQFLKASDFGEGTIIALNESILVVQEFGLTNPLFSFQKDGCGHRFPEHECCPPAVYPKPEIALILQKGRSEWCLPKHQNRLLVTVEELGFVSQITMSILMVIEMARQAKAGKIFFMCCDSMVGDTRTYDVTSKTAAICRRAGYYNYVKPLIYKVLQETPYEIVVPQ
jgi:hypothetical protein